jgi:hypothetical protein
MEARSADRRPKAGSPIARLPCVAPRRRIAAPGAMRSEAWMADDGAAPIDVLFNALQHAAIT